MKRLAIAYRLAVTWFERGDLVPLLVLVSAVHYAVVLAGADYWPVAIAIGLLVDLGHYRWVRAAAGYRGAQRWELIARWAWAILFTAVSLAYHQRYYADWWLSAPLPLLIASLAWLDARRIAQPKVAEPQKVAEPAPVLRYVCVTCGAGYAKQQQLAAHMRAHMETRKNGHKELVK